MKNVTITLDEDVAAWARVEAAKAGKSLSRYISDRLTSDRNETKEPMTKTAQRLALEQFLSGPGWPGISADRLSREELYAERVFHRHQPAAVRSRSKRARKGGKDRQPARHSRGS